MKAYIIRKADIILISILFLLGIILTIFLFLPNSQPAKYVRVEQNGAEIMTLPINKDTSQSISWKNGGSNTFVISNGTVSMREGDCHDKTCVRSGKISKTGESIVCLPHRLVITITSEDEKQPDAIAR